MEIWVTVCLGEWTCVVNGCVCEGTCGSLVCVCDWKYDGTA